MDSTIEPQIGVTAFDRLPRQRRRALLVLATCVQEAERRGDRDLARELCGMVLREARHAVEEL